MNYWLRLYTGILDDPKVQRLEAGHFKGWINILCLAKEGDGLLPSVEDIAFRLRITEADAARLTEALVQRGLLDSDGVNLAPHNWHKRQFESDLSTERVKRFRNAERNVSETSPETEYRAETEPEQSRAETEASRGKPRSVRRPVLPDDEYLDGLQKNPAYSMLNVRLCYHRMLAWCEQAGKQPSRRRFINWLNREDKPMTQPPQKKPDPGAPTVYTLEEAARLEQTFDWDDWVTQCIANGWRGQLEADRKLIAERGGPKEPWEHRVYEYLNAATEAA